MRIHIAHLNRHHGLANLVEYTPLSIESRRACALTAAATCIDSEIRGSRFGEAADFGLMKHVVCASLLDISISATELRCKFTGKGLISEALDSAQALRAVKTDDLKPRIIIVLHFSGRLVERLRSRLGFEHRPHSEGKIYCLQYETRQKKQFAQAFSCKSETPKVRKDRLEPAKHSKLREIPATVPLLAAASISRQLEKRSCSGSFAA